MLRDFKKMFQIAITPRPKSKVKKDIGTITRYWAFLNSFTV